MRRLVLTGIRQMALQDALRPVIAAPHDVLIRVGAVGVCGSDVHYYTTGRIGGMIVQYPFTVGHEFGGVIEAVGAAVTRVRPGDRVAVDPAMPCFNCDQCRAGRHHTCRNLFFLGCPGQVEGCLADFITMPETSCHPLAPHHTLEQAALIEPLSISAYAVKCAGALRDGCAAILGCGPIGLGVLLALRQAGVARIYFSEPVAVRRDFAMRCGAVAGCAPDDHLVNEIMRREPLGMDAVFECCGQQSALDQGVELLKPGGRLVLVGIPQVVHVHFDIDLIRRREICIQNIRRQNDCVAAGAKLLDAFPDLTAAMITHRFPPERTPDAFDLVADRRDGVIKAMIRFDEPAACRS